MKNNKIPIVVFWKKNKLVLKLFNIFGEKNLRLVGGAVREALNKGQTNDLDFAINVKPHVVKKILEKNDIKYKDKSKGHGTISIYSKNNVVEITSIRKDIKTFGREAKVKFVNSFKEDAKRRDFTINSIYSDLEGNLFDPYNGITDLQNKKIKFIGNPEKRIEEDNLRLLRYFRFLGVFCSNEGQLHLESLKACLKNFSKIQYLSKERIQLEFNKLLLSENVNFVFFILKSNNLLSFLIEGLQKISYENIKFFNTLPKESIIRMAYLIKKTSIETNDIKKCLRISNSNISKLQKVLSIKNLIKSENDAKVNKYFYGKEVSITSYKLNQFINKKNISFEILDILNHWNAPKLPIDGQDVITYKKKNGKEVGKILVKIEKWWVKNCFLPTREECIQKLKNI